MEVLVLLVELPLVLFPEPLILLLEMELLLFVEVEWTAFVDSEPVEPFEATGAVFPFDAGGSES